MTGSSDSGSGGSGTGIATYIVPQSRPIFSAVQDISPISTGQTMIKEVAEKQGLERFDAYNNRVYGGRTQAQQQIQQVQGTTPGTTTYRDSEGNVHISQDYSAQGGGRYDTVIAGPATATGRGYSGSGFEAQRISMLGQPGVQAAILQGAKTDPLIREKLSQAGIISMNPVPTPQNPVPVTQAGTIPPLNFNPNLAINRNVPNFQNDMWRIASQKSEHQKISDASAQKAAYVNQWWEKQPIQNKIVIGADTVLRKSISNTADFVLGNRVPSFEIQAYENVKGKQTAYQESGYWGGLGKNIMGNEAALVAGSGLAAGAGLGLVSQIPRVGPAIATVAGAGAVGFGVTDIAGKMQKGDVRGALTEGLGFMATAPFASAGFGMVGGRTISFTNIKDKLPAVSFGKPKGVIIEAGEVPVSPINTNINTKSSMSWRGFQSQNQLIGEKGIGANILLATPSGGVHTFASLRSAPLVPRLGIPVPPPQLTGNTRNEGTPSDRWEAYMGRQRVKTTDIYHDVKTDMGSKSIKTTIEQPVADIYLKVPAKDIPKVMNTLTGELEYVRTPQGSMMKIKPTSLNEMSEMGNVFRNRLGASKSQNMIGDISQGKVKGKLPSISDYIRMERKISLEPAQFTRTSVPERLSLPEITYDVDIKPDVPVAGKGRMDVWGGIVKGKDIYAGSTEIMAAPSRARLSVNPTLQLSVSQVTPFEMPGMRSIGGKAPSSPAPTPDTAASALAQSIKTALDRPDYGKYTSAYTTSKAYAATEPQISKVNVPASPVKIEIPGNKRYAQELAQNLADRMQVQGMPVMARKTKVMTRPTLNIPSEPLIDIQYFNQVKAEAPDRFNKNFGGSTLMGMNALSFDIKKAQQAGDVNFIGRFYGENPADIGLFNYEGVTGFPEITRKKQPFPVNIPSPQTYPAPRPQPQPSFKPLKHPQPEVRTDTWGMGGIGIKMPVIKIPHADFRIPGKKKKPKHEEKYFHTYRASPIMAASFNLGSFQKDLNRAMSGGKKKGKGKKT